MALLQGSLAPPLAVLAAVWLYYALMESSERQATLGKRAVGIKVTDLEGNQISFGRATGRLAAHILSGVILGIAERLKLPVRYVGLGENLEDLRPFDAREFVEALFSESEAAEESADIAAPIRNDPDEHLAAIIVFRRPTQFPGLESVAGGQQKIAF